MVSDLSLIDECPNLVSKCAARIYDKNGRIKLSIQYGNERHRPIIEGSVLVWVNASWDFGDERLFSYVDQLIASDYYISLCVVGNGVRYVKRNDSYASLVVSGSDAVRALAQSQTIVSFGMLPNYFIRREGQIRIHIASSDDLNANEISRAEGRLSSLLNATHIAVRDESECKRLVKSYQLENIYTGEFLTGIDDGFQLGRCIESIVEKTKEVVPRSTGAKLLEESKVKVLIYANCNWYRICLRYLRRLLQSVDREKYDITIVVQNLKGISAEEALKQLGIRERVIIRKGSISYDTDGFVELQVLNDMLASSDDPIRVIDNLPQDVLRGEALRLFGDASFDEFLFLSIPSPFWLAMTKCLPIEHKVFVRVANSLYGSCPSISTDNLYQLLNSLFDEVVFSNSSVADQARQLLDRCALSVWRLPFPLIQEQESPSERVSYLDTDYYLLDARYDKEGLLRGGYFVKAPSEGASYYVSCLPANLIPQAIESISSLNDDSVSVVLVASGDAKRNALSSMNAIPEYVTLISERSIDGVDGFLEIMGGAKGYIVFSRSDYSLLRLYFEHLDLPCYAIRNCQLESMRSLSQGKQSYESLCQCYADSILNPYAPKYGVV